MSALDDLKSAGFSDDEVNGYAQQQRQQLSSAGFSDDEINAHLGAPRTAPSMLTGNNFFARVLDAQMKAGQEQQDQINAEAVKKPWISATAPIEAALNVGTGLVTGTAAYLGGAAGGLISKYLLGLDADPKELAETMQHYATLPTFTPAGQQLAERIGEPLNALGEAASKGGHWVADATGSAALGAITDAALQTLPFVLLGELGRKMGGQTIGAEDMHNAAKVAAGPDASPAAVSAAESSLHATYEKTGIGPYTVLEQAMKDAGMRSELIDPAIEVPKEFQKYVEKPPAAPEAPIPGDGEPLLNLGNPGSRIEPKFDEPTEATAEAKPTEPIEQPNSEAFKEGAGTLNVGLNPAAVLGDIRDGYSHYVGVESDHAKPPSVDSQGKPVSRFADDLRRVLAPASRGELAAEQAGIMRANFGEMAHENVVAEKRLFDYAKTFDKMPVAENVKFIDAYEHGVELTDPKLNAAAQALHEMNDGLRKQIQDLGKGQLENFEENYLGRIWKDPETANGDLYARRPLEGNKNFLKARTIPFYTDGLRWRAYDASGDFVKSFATESEAKMAAGTEGRVGAPLEPITTNPVEMALLKGKEMRKYIYGQRIFTEMKDADLARFVGFGERALPGWTKIDDKIARVWSPSDIDIHEAFDKQMMGKLQDFARQIGVDVSRSVSVGSGKTWGWANPSGKVATRFGGPETVLTHELGHELDFKYGLADQFVNDPATKVELRKLADLRFEGQDVPASFKTYVRKGTEKMANMVHAFVHMPERFQQVAPNTFRKFNEFLDQHPELSGLRDIKPSLTLGSNKATVNAGGMILRGEYYAPDEAATLINNHLRPSALQGNSFFDAWRAVGNAVNGLQLGLSFFHVGFTSMDAIISKAALGVKQISRGDIAEGLGNVGMSLTGPVQSINNLLKGDKLLRAYNGGLEAPELSPLVQAIQDAGGRVKIDDFYRNESVNAFRQALRNEQYWGATKAFLPTVLDRISAPIFEWLVPRQKLGVFADMADDWIKQNPDAELAARREGLGKLWDSVDNRMGQLVYDNVFWNRTLKDGLMASVRSVGWNLGTFREIGGGLLDIKNIAKDKGFSDRTAYVIALPALAAVYGSVMHYLYNGQPPEDLKDAFYPRTGRLRPDGSEDRVSLPTYMKDVFAYGEDATNFVKYGSDPTQTLKNKANPLISTVSQMLNNQDFFGAAIRNPADPATKQIMDEAAYILQQVEPFSLRNYQQQAKLKGEEPSVLGYLTSPSMVGITPAPAHITKSETELESQHVSALHDPLVQKFRQQIKGGANAQDLIPEMIKSGMTKRDIKYIISSSGDTPRPHRLKSFGTDESE